MDSQWVTRHLSGIQPTLLNRISEAEEEMQWVRSASADDLLDDARSTLRIERFYSPFRAMTAIELGNLRHRELVEELVPLFDPGTEIATDLADQIQLQRAFADPTTVTLLIADLVKAAVEKFPAKAEDLKVGHNPGDVLDPFILAANFELLSEGNLQRTIETSVSHKVLMKIEDLVGNLHQTTIGFMRGNFRVPEPQGSRKEGKEMLHPTKNPFPGADVGQVPAGDKPERLRLFQVKSKTGSAKGGDGVRLGRQLQLLRETYDADTFFVAVVGNTLRGHRSRGAVERESPGTAVLVGAAALNELTQSSVGGELLLRTYQRAFRQASRETGYSFAEVVASICEAFERDAETDGEGFLEAWLHRAIDGPINEQDSRAGQAPLAP
jgi:hypothetical protein